MPENIPTNSIAAGATATVSHADRFADIKKTAEDIGAMAAQSLLQQHQMGQLPAFLKQSSAAIPAPQVMQPTAPTPALDSELGGGQTNYGLRKSHDKTSFINELSAGVDKALNEHKAKEIRKATMEYQNLFNAMSSLKLGHDVEHNKAIVEAFFDDKAKVKRLKDVMGFDAFDMAKEKKKEESPEYQALQKIRTQTKVPVPTQTVDTATMQPNPMPTPEQANTSGVPQEPSWMANLPDNAKGFMRQMPSMPPPNELEIQASLIDKGLLPKAGESLTFAGKALDAFKDIQVGVMSAANATELKKIEGDYGILRERMGNDSAKYVAELNFKSARISDGIKAMELRLKKDENNLKAHEAMLTLTREGVEMQRKKVLAIQEVLGKDDAKVDKKGLGEELRVALQSFYDEEAKYNSAYGNYLKAAGANQMETAQIPNKTEDFNSLLAKFNSRFKGGLTPGFNPKLT
jgi:hypothetical protein